MGLNDYVITLDVDWASDPVIEQCARSLIDAGVKATWLVTHDSEGIRGLASRPDLFELGIHPNFLAGSTQGNETGEVLGGLLEIVPGARSIRTHCLVQSTPLLRELREEHGLCYELSLLLPEAANLAPHELHFPESSLLRFPTFWCDDVEMDHPRPNFSFDDPKYHVPGLKIFCLHPIHIALNSADKSAYEELKAGRNIAELTLDDIAPHVRDADPGAGTLFRELIAFIATSQSGPGLTVSELAEKWRALRDSH